MTAISKKRLTLKMKHDLLKEAWGQIWERDLPDGIEKPKFKKHISRRYPYDKTRVLSKRDWHPIWCQIGAVIPDHIKKEFTKLEIALHENVLPKSDRAILRKYNALCEVNTIRISRPPELKKHSHIFRHKEIAFHLEKPLCVPKSFVGKNMYGRHCDTLVLKKHDPFHKAFRKLTVDILRYNLKISRKIRAKMGAYCELLEKTVYIVDLIEAWPDAERYIESICKVNFNPKQPNPVVSQKSKDIILNDWASKDERLQAKETSLEDEINKLTKQVSILKQQMGLDNPYRY